MTRKTEISRDCQGRMFRDNTGKSYLVTFILVAGLFFLWGFAHSILDVLNKHFQDVLVISKARSGLVQATMYGGYFLMALPAGQIIRKWGYRAGIVLGLLLYGTGALMFIPGERIMSFPFFLLCLFVIGCGLTCLETSANPYVTVLGDKRSSARRLNLAQSFNGLGWIAGPLAGGLLILGDDSDLSLPYAIIGTVVLILGIVFSKLPLPSMTDAESGAEAERPAEKRIWSVNYVTECGGESISARTAALMLSFGGMGLFMAGRLAGSAVMGKISPRTLMTACSAGAMLCMTITVMSHGIAGIAALCLTYLFESIMFPTIFSMALTDVGDEGSKTASSFLIMSIVGGAIVPVPMGLIGEKSMSAGFIVPLACFAAVLSYSIAYRYLKNRN